MLYLEEEEKRKEKLAKVIIHPTMYVLLLFWCILDINTGRYWVIYTFVSSIEQNKWENQAQAAIFVPQGTHEDGEVDIDKHHCTF